MHSVRFYFDFLSPYSCLALMRAEEFQREHGVHFVLKPVAFGPILDHHAIRGAGEVPAKRAYVAADIQRVAQADGFESFPGPPVHPFLSLSALRVAILFDGDERQLELCSNLAHRCWVRGQDLTDFDVLTAAVRDCGLDATDLDARILPREVKRALKANSQEALEAGVFGVPTFVWNDELFWGQDRLSWLARRLTGELSSPLERSRDLLQRPPGTDRTALR